MNAVVFFHSFDNSHVRHSGFDGHHSTIPNQIEIRFVRCLKMVKIEANEKTFEKSPESEWWVSDRSPTFSVLVSKFSRHLSSSQLNDSLSSRRVITEFQLANKFRRNSDCRRRPKRHRTRSKKVLFVFTEINRPFVFKKCCEWEWSIRWSRLEKAAGLIY